jgi:hypothetical protein
VLKKQAKSADAIAIVSYDEKPGVQAIGVTTPDLPAVAGIHPTVERDHEYKRHGTVSLPAGIDLLTGKVRALVKDRHRSSRHGVWLSLTIRSFPQRLHGGVQCSLFRPASGGIAVWRNASNQALCANKPLSSQTLTTEKNLVEPGEPPLSRIDPGAADCLGGVLQLRAQHWLPPHA